MSRVCDLCKKGYLKGNLVPRGIGRRVTRRTIRRQKVNLRTVRMAPKKGDNKITMKLCTSCYKRIRKNQKEETK